VRSAAPQFTRCREGVFFFSETYIQALLNEPRFAPVLGLKMPAQGKKTSRKLFEGGVLWTYLPLLSGPWWAQLQAGCSCTCLANSRTSTSSGPRFASEERGAPVQGVKDQGYYSRAAEKRRSRKPGFR